MAEKTIVLTLVCEGESMTISRAQGYSITALDGLESSDVTLQLQPDAQNDGGRATGVRIEPRVVEVEAVYLGTRDKESVRARWLHFLNPHNEFLLKIEYCEKKRHVMCHVSVPFRDLRANLCEPLRFSFGLTCPKPALLGEGFHENMAGVIPMLCAPFSLFSNTDDAGHIAGATAAYKIFRERLTVNNTGDMDVGIVLTFTAKGPLKNPRLDNLTTGEYIRVLCDMDQGDLLMVSTVQGKKRVEMNGENISNQKDRQSKFFQLRRGVNVLQYSAEENYMNLEDVRPSCDFAYLGV